MSTAIGAANSTPSAGRITNEKGKLRVEDFINMMVTQLQNQDPMEPAKNEQLLAQMSQIGQLQSQQELTSNQKLLTDSIKTMVLQNNIGAASNLIGKDVAGPEVLNASGKVVSQISGKVEGVSIKGNGVVLRLDSGDTLELDKVTSVDGSGATTSSSGTDLAQAIKNSAHANIGPWATGFGPAAQ